MSAVKQYRSLLEDIAFVEKKVWGQNADRYFGEILILVFGFRLGLRTVLLGHNHYVHGGGQVCAES